MPKQELAEKIGTVAAQEFDAAENFEKPKLLEWLQKLPVLSEDDLEMATREAIYNSALAQRFRGNWDGDHCKASAAHYESGSRLVAAGHERRCQGESIYGRAYAKVLRSEGHTPTAPGTCRCNLSEVAE